MLYTRKGDGGSTQTFGCCDQRISKSSVVAEALGTLDEANSFLGVCKVKTNNLQLTTDNKLFKDVIDEIQQNLFIVQAEVAGADKSIASEKIKEIEKIIDEIEKELPPIKTFFVSGGSELSAHLDFARTLIRRAERRATAVQEEAISAIGSPEEGLIKISADTQSYLNRLSSLLYALARYSNHKAGIVEEKPRY